MPPKVGSDCAKGLLTKLGSRANVFAQGQQEMQKVKIILETDELMPVLEAAKYLGVHFTTVYRWIKAGKLHPIPIAGQDYLASDEVKALKEKNEQAAQGS